MQDADAVFNDF